jgi:hypothetical protein
MILVDDFGVDHHLEVVPLPWWFSVGTLVRTRAKLN